MTRRMSQQRAAKYQHRLCVLQPKAAPVDDAGHPDYTDTDAWRVLGYRWFELVQTGQRESDRADQIESITTYRATSPADDLTDSMIPKWALRDSDNVVYNIEAIVNRDDVRSEIVLDLARAA